LRAFRNPLAWRIPLDRLADEYMLPVAAIIELLATPTRATRSIGMCVLLFGPTVSTVAHASPRLITERQDHTLGLVKT
jgi:hypothetical protein